MEINGRQSSQQHGSDHALEAEIKEHSIEVAGMQIHFLMSGEGSPLILLHGHGDDSSTWRQVLPALARNNRVYALDFPGAGKSTKLSVYVAPPSFYCDFLASFPDALKLDRAVIVGSSHGGLIALRLALATPNRVLALGLIDSAGLGQATHPALTSLTIPGYGDATVAWWRTPLGATQWVTLFASLALRDPLRVPPEWFANLYRLSQTPGHLQTAVLSCLRGLLSPVGARSVPQQATPSASTDSCSLGSQRCGRSDFPGDRSGRPDSDLRSCRERLHAIETNLVAVV